MKAAPQYVFGYGSLINSESRAGTLGIATDATAATFSGLERGWGVPNNKAAMSGLGAIAKSGCTTNGVLFEVTDERLESLEKRERPHGYKRERLSTGDTAPPLDLPDGAVVWVYVMDSSPSLSETHPIVQS